MSNKCTNTDHTPYVLIAKHMIHLESLSPHVSTTPKTTVKHHRTWLIASVGKPYSPYNIICTKASELPAIGGGKHTYVLFDQYNILLIFLVDLLLFG